MRTRIWALIRDWPIRWKLTLTGLVTTLIALLMAGTSISGYQWFQYRSDVASELESVADMIAVNASAPVIFSDSQSAEKTLAPLKAVKGVATAAIYRAGQPFATYVREGVRNAGFPAGADVAHVQSDWVNLRVSRSIVVDGENVGAVYIRSDMPDVGLRLSRNGSIMAAVMFAAALLGLFASSVLARIISSPIQHLAGVAREVSSGASHGVRAVRESADELGILTEAFNSMLDQIDLRDQDLENQVAARTAELTLTNQQLAASRDKANAAVRMQSEFLANMSHEIRTPMNIIIGMTQLTLDTELDARQRRHLSMVRGSAEALLIIINDILDFSKIEAGKLDLDPVRFGLDECLRDRTASLAVRAQEKGIELQIRIDPEVPDMIVGDPVRIGQIVVNLVNNATKFSSGGTIEIRVSLDAHEPLPAADSVLLRFSITDHGIGIPAEKIGMIFEAFTQADGSTTRRYGGTGLGLPISRRLAEMMGGRLWAESEVGKGSRFMFTIRVALASPAPVALASLSGPKGPRGIVIMPEQEQRNCLTAMLGTWHIEAASVDSPAAALDVIKWSLKVGRPFSFAVIDSAAAEPDGDFVRALRMNPELRGLPIMMIDLTGSRSGQVPAQGERGVPARLTWPVSQSDLLQAINGLQSPVAGASRSLPAISSAADRPGSEGDHASTWAGLRRVLLAEDNPMNQELILALLETKIPLSAVETVDDGAEALRVAMEKPFDLILMDIQMPLMSGVEVTTAIRKNEAKLGGHTPIVALTAHAMKGDREKYLRGGMDGYVSKPIDSAVMYREIERVMQLQTPASSV